MKTYKIKKLDFMKLYNFNSESSLKNFMKKSMSEQVYNSIYPLPAEFTIKFDSLGCATFHDEKDVIFADYSTLPNESLHFQTIFRMNEKMNEKPEKPRIDPKIYATDPHYCSPNLPGFTYNPPSYRDGGTGIMYGPDTIEHVFINGKPAVIRKPGPC